MQVSLTTTGALMRRLEVAVPAAEVAGAVEGRLKNLARTARLKGFRPGKAPVAVVRQQFGGQVHAEVVDELMRSSFADAVAQHKLKPASGPRIEPIAMEPGVDLKYAAVFEVLPEFTLAPIQNLRIERLSAAVSDADVDAMLESMRAQRPNYVAASRAAARGDRVTVDFDGRIDGQAFPGGEGRDVSFVLGAGRVLPEFEAAVIGALVSEAQPETRTARLRFPDDYSGKDVAGKEAEFTITVKRVEIAELPAIDEEFCRAFAVNEGGVAALRASVRENMESELKDAIRQHLRAQVMDALYRSNPFDVPASLVEQTIEELQQDFLRRTGARDLRRLPARESFVEPARRRIALQLIVGELIRGQDLKVDRARVNTRLTELAAVYPNPEEMRRAYLQSADAMRQLESAVLEDQLIDSIVERCQVTDKPSSFKEITGFKQTASTP